MKLPPPPTPTRREEKQLAHGVYFTPAPTAKPSAVPSSATPVDQLSIDELRSQRDALQKSVDMLRASNRQILEFDPARQDATLVTAVDENEEIIARREARVALIEERIRVLRPSGECYVQASAVAGVSGEETTAVGTRTAGVIGATAPGAATPSEGQASRTQGDQGMYL